MKSNYKIGPSMKETLMVIISKAFLSGIAVDDEEDVFSIEDALDSLEIDIADNGELIVMNPPDANVISQELIEKYAKQEAGEAE